MKRSLKKALKPDQPFEKWAKEHGIELNNNSPKTPEKASGRVRRKNKKARKRRRKEIIPYPIT